MRVQREEGATAVQVTVNPNGTNPFTFDPNFWIDTKVVFLQLGYSIQQLSFLILIYLLIFFSFELIITTTTIFGIQKLNSNEKFSNHLFVSSIFKF
jgi:hypothetical protein